LTGYPVHVRKTYEDFVEETCRQTGERYLEEGDIGQAWRYFRTIGEREPIRKALEKLPAADATDEILSMAIQENVHPARGFELLLELHGICRAITVYEHQFDVSVSARKRAAAMLVRRLYRDLVLAVRRDIQEREMRPARRDRPR